MSIKTEDVVTRFIADLSQFIQGTNMAPKQVRKMFKAMTAQMGGFATTVDNQGRRISGSWWKRFGTVALGFTIAYRAMNVFENGLMKLGSIIKTSILQSGQLAEQQAKNAFWMTVFAEKTLTFADAFKIAAASTNALREESVRSISSIDELTTGIDELAQAGLPITKNLIPQMVSLVDFTGMVAQTVGSTTRQIRQEFQALMDGTTRVTNQLVRVLTNMGVLTRGNLEDLRAMTNRAEIFEKVVDAIHTRWRAMVTTLIVSSPERAFAFWEKSIQKVLIESVLLASQLKGVENIFGKTLYDAAIRFQTGMAKMDMARLVNLMNMLNSGLGFLVNIFNKAITGVATFATVAKNLANELSLLWRIIGDAALIVLATKALQGLGKMMLWLAVGPIKTLGRALMFLFSPLILFPAALAGLGILLTGQITLYKKELQDFWNELKNWDWGSLFSIKVSTGLVPKEEGVTRLYDPNSPINKFFDNLYEKVLAIRDAFREFIDELRKEANKPFELHPAIREFLGLVPSVRMPMPKGEIIKMPMPVDPKITEDQLKKLKKLASSIVEDIRPPAGVFDETKDFIINAIKQQGDAFKIGLDVLKKSADPYVKQFMTWFDKLFKAPGVGGLADKAGDVDVAFQKMLSPLTLDGLKKMEHQMKKFGDETPAFVEALEMMKIGVITTSNELAEFMKSQTVLESYNRIMTDLAVQMAKTPVGSKQYEKRHAEYLDLVAFVEKYKEEALAHIAIKYAIKRQQDQLEAYNDIQSKYNELVMTGSAFALWSFNEELIALKKLAEGNDILTAALEKYSIIRKESLEREFNGLAKLASDVAQNMESSFSDLFFDVMTLNWEDLGDLTENTLRGMQRALADFFAQATKDYFMGEQTGGGAFASGVFSALLNKLLGGGSTQTPMTSSMAETAFPEFYSEFTSMHRGGTVGKDYTSKRMLPISLLENAVRLHTGLKRNDFPTILETGERVYGKNETAIEGVTIINNTGFTPQVSETKRPGGGKDIRVVIGEISASDIYKGGSLDKAIRATYGLQPQTVRR